MQRALGVRQTQHGESSRSRAQSAASFIDTLFTPSKSLAGDAAGRRGWVAALSESRQRQPLFTSLRGSRLSSSAASTTAAGPAATAAGAADAGGAGADAVTPSGLLAGQPTPPPEQGHDSLDCSKGAQWGASGGTEDLAGHELADKISSMPGAAA